METANIEKKITNVINSLGEIFEKEIIDKNSGLFEYLEEKLKKNGINDFLFKNAEMKKNQYETLLIKVLDIPKSENSWIVYYLVSGEFDEFIRRYIMSKEGLQCYADKTRFIISTLYKALKENKNISLYDENKEEKHQMYCSPSSLKDTDEVINKFGIFLDKKAELIDSL